MNSMLEALKRKMHGKDEEPILEIDIEGHKDDQEDDGKEGHEYESADEVAGPAPHLEHEIIVEGEGSPEEEAGESDQEEGEELEAGMGNYKEPGQEEQHIEEGGPEHMKMLEALSDRHSGSGRETNGLHERAAHGAKSKMAMLSKHKHMKRG